MSTALLNSGTFGVEVAEVVGLAEADAVGLDDADVVLTYTFPVRTAVKPLFVIVK
jgi:hypothetical protein